MTKNILFSRLVTSFLLLLFLVTFTVTNAQVKRVLCNWNPAGQSTSQKVFPWSNYTNPDITSSSMNYSGLITTTDSRFNFFSTPTTLSIDIGSNPYISFIINTGSNSIDLDRFVLQGFDGWGGQTSLRYSVDGYASHLGSVTKGTGFSLTSVDLSSIPNISGSVEFRLYFYGTTSNSTIWLGTGGTNAPSDSTPTIPYQGGSTAGLPTRYQWSSASFWYTVPQPTITSFSPAAGSIGSMVVINGTNFTGATQVWFNNTLATITVNSSTQITATVPSGATTGTISVTSAGLIATSSSSFTILPPPTISSFTPSSGAIGSTITITGTNLTGATAVSFNGTNSTDFTINSATQITARVPAGATTGTIAVSKAGATVTSSSTITIGGEVLLEYPFNGSLTPSIGTGAATISSPGTTTILGSNSVCTDTDWNSIVKTAAIPLASFNTNAFQFDLDFSLPSLPTATSYLLNSSNLGRDFGVRVSSDGRLSVFYKTLSVWEVNSQSTNVQLAINTNYNLSVQFIGNTIRMKLNGTLVLVVDVADGLVIPNDPLFIIGDAYGARLPMSACIDNFRFIKDPLPFSIADQLVVSPNAFTSFEACVNSPSAVQTFTISGTNLSNNTVSIRPPSSNYEISRNGTSFGTIALSISATAGTLNPTTFYVRVKSSSAAAVLSPSLNNILNIEVGSSNPLYRKSYILQGNISALPTISGVQNMTVGGNTLQLTGSGIPNATTPWSSSNTAVATISSTGEVTAVAAGTTTISYTISNGCSATTTIKVIDCAQPFGNALNFGAGSSIANDDYVEVNSRIFPSQSMANFTIETWINPSASDILSGTAGTDWMSFLGYTDLGRNPSFYITNNGVLTGAWVENSAGRQFPSDNNSPVLVQNKWSHVALVKDGTTMRLYLDGVQKQSMTCQATVDIPLNKYWIGHNEASWSGSKQFKGTLDEVRFWSTARSAAQIQAAMNTELVGNESGLLTYFDFNQGIAGGTNTSITTVTNKANNALNGTLNNFAKSGTISNFVGGTISNFNILGSANLCANSTSQYTHPIAGGTWSLSNGATATISTSGLLTSTVNENITLSYTYNLNGCSLTATKAITINTPATPVTNATVNLCRDTTATALTATATTGNTLQWYTVASGGTATTTAPTPSTTSNGSRLYYVSQKADQGGCESTRTEITVTVASTPPTINTQPLATIEICQSLISFYPYNTIAADVAGGSSLQWYSNTTNSTVGGTPVMNVNNVSSYGNIISTLTFNNSTGTTYYYLVATGSNGCTTTSSISAVTVSPTAVAGSITTATPSICFGESATLTVSGHTGTVQWQQKVNSSTYNPIEGATSTTFITPPFTNTNTYRALVSSSSCNTVTTNEVTVTVAPARLLNQGLGFDGVDDKVTISNSPRLPVGGTSGFTLEAWVYVDPTMTNQSGGIVSKNVWQSSPTADGTGLGYGLDIENGKARFILGRGVGTRAEAISGSAIPTGTWVHIAGTYNNSIARLYVNGVQDGYAVVSDAFWNNDSAPLTIGSWPLESKFFKGKIDEVRIWNTVRSAIQILHNKNKELIGNEAGLVANYDFNQGTPNGANAAITTILDKSSNALNGTLQNFSLSGTSSNWIASGAMILSGTTMCANETTTLTHTDSGGSWSSSNTSVLSVNASTGVATAIAGGTATVSYVYTLNGCTYTSTKLFTVANSVAITSHPNTSTQNLFINDSVSALTVSVSGSGLTYQWYSNTSATNTGGTLIVGATSASYTPSTTTVGTMYYYCIVGSGSCSSFTSSNVSGAIIISPTITVPSAPTNLVASTGDGQIGISFTAGNNGGSAITNYEYTINGGTTWEAVNPAVTSSPVTIPGLTNSTAYTVSLRALNSVGTSVASTSVTATPLPGGPACTTYTNKTTTSGLVNNQVRGVFAIGSSVYAATPTGLSISTDGGATFTNRTTSNGLGSNNVNGVYAIGSTVYAATAGGLSISTDGGVTFTNRTTLNGLGNNNVNGIYTVGSTVYVATFVGLSISTDGGVSFTNRTTVNGLGSNNVNGVYTVGSIVYAATTGGLSVSLNGGGTFTNRTTTSGLGNNRVKGVFAIGNTVYAATEDGLSISTDGGVSFTNRTTANGLGSNLINAVYAIGSTVYVATSDGNGIGGLSISTNGGISFTNLRTTNGLGSNFIYGVFAAANTVYAATGGGVSYCFAPTAPLAPTSLIATPGDGQIGISFTAGNNGGSAITNYEYTINGGTTWTALNPADGTSPVTIAGLTNGTPYSIKLRAVNSLGFGAASSPVIATPLLALPSISFASPTSNAVVNRAITIATINSGGAATFTITPALPSGLVINSATGVISGTTTTAMASSQYTVTATNTAGTSTATVTIIIDADTDGDGTGDATDTDIDGDGVPNTVELQEGTSPTNRNDVKDTDSDGVPDYIETQQGTNPNLSGDVLDTDGDEVPDYSEVQQGTNPNNPNDARDTDGDGVPDYTETQQGTDPSVPRDVKDTDGDGIPDYIESQQGTNPNIPGDQLTDSDGDGVPNYIETLQGTNPNTPGDQLIDSDGDGVPNYAEVQQGTNPNNPNDARDSDGDGVPNYIEIEQGTNPSNPNDVKDTDGDGIPDYIESQQGTNPNTPGDQLIDSDGDGVPNYIEELQGTNPNTPGDQLIDSDNDGVPDYVEAQQGTNPTNPNDARDSDGDGVPDYIEIQQGTNPSNSNDINDTDGDGVPDYIESQQGTNPSLTGDAVDADSDGIPDYIEEQQGTSPSNPSDYKDSDGDGVPDYVEVQQGTNPANSNDVKDTDGDGVPDFIEAQQSTNPNVPGDQLVDSDGDGVPNYIEALQGTNPNAPGDQLIDTDSDGVPDYIEVQQGTNPTNSGDFKDTDGDGVPNYIEVQQGTNPVNPDDVKDTDGDGIADFIEVRQGTNPMVPGDQLIDSDGDGVPNYIEIIQGTNPTAPGDQLIDTDGDGVPNYVEVQQGTNPNNPNDARDSDGDGVPNYIEIQQGTNPSNPNDAKDTDGDGIPDYIEAQQGTNPTVPGDQLIDSDNDGIPNYIEELQGTNPNTPGDRLIDSDGDGIPNYAEVQQGTNPNNPNDARDSDSDGVPDYVEVQQGTNPSNPNDVKDTDGDGIPDYIEAQQGTNPTVPGDLLVDSDGDGVPNYIEALQGTNPNVPGDELIDSDGDGVPDYIEIRQGTQPGTPGDTKDSDGDGVPDYIEIQQGSNPSNPTDLIDTDGDGIPDYIETQQGTNPNLPGDAKDTDGDGIPNYVEFLQGTNPNAPGDQLMDTDGDGVPDYVEIQQGTNPTVPDNRLIDSDGDGVPNFVELQEGTNPNNPSDFKDDDGDGVSNYEEGYNSQNPAASIDTDGDGAPDYLDADSDGDGILDRNDAFPTNPSEWTDSDGDGIGDKTDLDDDNDGILDACDGDVNGDGVPDNSTDIDGDGTIDSCDTDKDGDGVNNVADNCPDLANANQADRDQDGLGNVCDTIELNTMEGLTPNGDGINDVWIIYNIENHPGSTVRVFNANGTQVFYSANYQNNWTGNYQGSNEMLPIGSYMFQIDLGGDGTIDSQGWMYISK